eukprot:gene5057-54916_t
MPGKRAVVMEDGKEEETVDVDCMGQDLGAPPPPPPATPWPPSMHSN